MAKAGIIFVTCLYVPLVVWFWTMLQIKEIKPTMPSSHEDILTPKIQSFN